MTTDHRNCGQCITDQRSGVPGVLCHAGHFHANEFTAGCCTSRPTHDVASTEGLWPSDSWGVCG